MRLDRREPGWIWASVAVVALVVLGEVGGTRASAAPISGGSDPGAPTIGTATPANTSASVAFTAPSSDGGSAITSYTVTAADSTTPANGNQTASGASSPITVTGLTNGDSYTFTVTATNGVGTGPASGASNAVTPDPTSPDAPTIGTATPANTSASVVFSPPGSDGGSAIASYTVTAADSTNSANGNQTASGSSSPITVTGLTNGDTYTFTVTATNGVGTGPASAPSNPVVPGQCPSGTDSYSSAVLADSPIAYYRLDESSGPVMCDSSSSANNGTYGSSGITYGVAGALSSSSDTAVAGDGTPTQVGQSAADPAGVTGNHAFTLEAWFKNAETTTPYTNADLVGLGVGGGSGQNAILSLYPNHGSQLQRGPASCFGIDQNGADYCWDATTVSVNLWDGNWHYMAVTYDPNASPQFTGFVDGHNLGAPVSDQYGNPTPNIAAEPIYVGGPSDPNGYFKPLDGSLDEVAVYPSALSSTRIDAHWNAAQGLPGAPTIGTATPGNTSASVAFSAPASTGSSTITSYTVTAADSTNSAHGGQTATGSSSPITVTGLTNGDSYTFTVAATNGVGTGPASAASNAVVPAVPVSTGGVGVSTPPSPTPAPPPPGTSSSDATPLSTTAVSPSGPTTLTSPPGDTPAGVSASVTVPPGALPAGTTVTEYSVNTSSFTPPPGASFVVGFAVSWTGASATQTNSSGQPIPVTMTINDPSIVAGDVIYMVGPTGALVPVGIADANGTVTVSFTQDPAFLVAAPASSPSPTPPAVPTPSAQPGYRLAGADGGVFSFGDAAFHGSAGGLHLAAPIVGMAVTPDGAGYWLVGADGGVFSFGDAAFHGSAGGLHLAAPIVGMASTPDGAGYWLVGADGGVFSFGDAAFHGSAGALHVAAPIVGMASTPDGAGYWLVARDGTVRAYGDAKALGGESGHNLAAPIVGIAATPDGAGYWLVAADGGVFSFGDAVFHGSAGALHVAAPIVGMASTPDGAGYWLVGADGGVFSFGDAAFHGSAGALHVAAPIVGVAVPPSDDGRPRRLSRAG